MHLHQLDDFTVQLTIFNFFTSGNNVKIMKEGVKTGQLSSELLTVRNFKKVISAKFFIILIIFLSQLSNPVTHPTMYKLLQKIKKQTETQPWNFSIHNMNQ